MTPLTMSRMLKLKGKRSLFKSRMTNLQNCFLFFSHFYPEAKEKTSKILIMKQFLQKYDAPSWEEAVNLEMIYGDADDIVNKVLQQFVRAEIIPSCTPLVTNHLNGLYWKASLLLPYPLRLSATAVHPDRDVAVKRANLLFCDRLKEIGLICQGENKIWEPLKHEQVTTMLDTLAKYGEESGGRASGKGIKVLLEQLKEETFKERLISIVEPETCQLKENSKLFRDDFVSSNSLCDFSQKYCDDLDKTKTSFKVTGYDQKCRTLGDEDVIDGQVEFSCQESSTYDVSLHPVDETVRSLSKKLKWKCTVHVGWPVPFSVYSYGASLPSAQLMGYLAVASKLKILGLLKPCNSQVFEQILKGCVWKDATVIHAISDSASFKADAELFCDASQHGYGAYLLQKDTRRISWISEPWESHPEAMEHLVIKSKTTQQELFCAANALFTWKKKLKNKRLLIFCDNQGVVQSINGYVNHSFCIDDVEPIRSSLTQLIISVQRDYNITMKAVWLHRYYNTLADQLARQNYNIFQRFVAPKKSKIKKITFQTEQINQL